MNTAYLIIGSVVFIAAAKAINSPQPALQSNAFWLAASIHKRGLANVAGSNIQEDSMQESWYNDNLSIYTK